MEWQEFEKRVRRIASYLWDRAAEPETINGVKVDCVCKVKPDYWITIEITQENSLEKLRADLAKFATTRPFLLSKNIYSECYFVCESRPLASLVVSGEGENVTVLSFESFQKLFLDYPSYTHIRSSRPFGSAVNPSSGVKDNINYVPVEYIDANGDGRYRIQDIAKLLMSSRRIVLVGNYGTGKSRCIQELFSYFDSVKEQLTSFPLSIDLRLNWGTIRATEIIRRHFDDLGFTGQAENAIKVLPNGGIILLLDGFDEMGSQTWSDDPSRLKEIRAKSLLGVKDLIQTSKGGVFITGREHYFSSDHEMFECLGLDEASTIFLRCADEFTDREMHDYLKNISADLPLPAWLPKRPLICKIISDIDIGILTKLMSEEGEVDFWYRFIRAVCERESRISKILDGVTIKKILCVIAGLTRSKEKDVGPITILEINQAFEQVVGTRPSDESAIILQRLPTLGRVASESPDRQFVDPYVLDGLRADNLIEIVMAKSETALNEIWRNPLRRFGISVVGSVIDVSNDRPSYLSYMHRAALQRNVLIGGDIIAAICECTTIIDFHDVSLMNSHITYLDLSNRQIYNLHLTETIIEELDISELESRKLIIDNCIITRLNGISGPTGLPAWMLGNSIEKFQELPNVSAILASKLTDQQKIFLTIIKKVFFQPGAGRKEEALLRGLGAKADSKIANKLLVYLLDEGIIERFKGDEGWVYTPNRSHTHRMKTIRSQLTECDDPLWKELDSLK